MYNNSRARLAAYNQVASLEVDKVKQIGLLYEGTIKFLQLAAIDIEINDLIAKAEHTKRALDIISYLQSILDFDRGGEVAQTLDVFYRSIAKLVVTASFSLDPKSMRRAAELMLPVCEAWFLNAKTAKVAAGESL